MPLPEIRIPLSAPDIREAEIKYVNEVLRGRVLSQGDVQSRFEAAFAERIGTAHAIAVSSGTAGLHLALLALGIEPGDEVITSPFAVPATANAIRMAGATPVFVDIEEQDLNLSADAVIAALGPRTRAVLAIHTFGLPADMPALRSLCERNGLALLEDACEGLGATFTDRRARERPLGSLGDLGVFGFYPNKQITTGEGGMVLSDDSDRARLIRSLRNHGRESGGWLDQTRAGFNYRLSEIACALGLAQLDRLDEILAQRARVAERYLDNLADNPAIELPRTNRHGRHSWFVFTVRLASHRKTRDQVFDAMSKRGIQCGRYFAPLHLQPLTNKLANKRGQRFPVTEDVAGRMLALPFHNRLTDADIDEVSDTLIKLTR